MPIYLALKEVWHSKGRYLLISFIVALITTLILFIAALGEGLGNGNREYISKLNGELLVYQEKVDISIAASRIGRNTVAQIRRVDGVTDVGQVGFSTATILTDDPSGLDVSLIGVEPGKPGEPPVLEGVQLERLRGNEVIIDGNVAERTNIQVGDEIVIKTTQGTEEEQFPLKVVGRTDGRAYFIAPSLIVPYLTWEKIRPQGGTESSEGDLVSNIAVVKINNPDDLEGMAERIEQGVGKVEVVDRVTAYENTPGYSAQQSTLDTQRYFTFFIGVLVIGGFFQTQPVLKVAPIEALKAIEIGRAHV